MQPHSSQHTGPGRLVEMEKTSLKKAGQQESENGKGGGGGGGAPFAPLAAGIAYAMVIHRKLSSIDEASTDEEQRDKIIYYFPENTPLYQQLSQSNMLEGLIEFSNKFSEKPIETVTMRNTTWVFSKCEEDFWIIIGANNLISAPLASSSASPPDGLDSSGSSGGDANAPRGDVSLGASDLGSSRGGGDAFSGHHTHKPYGAGLSECINRLYRIYVSTHPKINAFLAGSNGDGWKKIETIQTLRKKVRKLGVGLKQHYLDKKSLGDRQDAEIAKTAAAKTRSRNIDGRENNNNNNDDDDSSSNSRSSNDNSNKDNDDNNDVNDANNINNSTNETSSGSSNKLDDSGEMLNVSDVLIEEEQIVEQLGIKVGKTSIEEIDNAIADTKRQIIEIQKDLDSQLVQYHVKSLRESFSRYMRWFLLSGECSNSSGLNGLSGIDFIPVGSNAVGSLLRVQQSIDDCSKKICIGCMILYDGHVCWSDLDDDTTYNVYEAVRIQEMRTIRKSLIAELTVVNELRHSQSKGSNTSSSSTSLKQMKGWVEAVKSQCGFISRNWDATDFDEYVVSPLTSVATSNMDNEKDKKKSDASSDQNGEEDNEEVTTAFKMQTNNVEKIAIQYLSEQDNFDEEDSESESDGSSDGDKNETDNSDITLDSLSTNLELFCPKVYISSADSSDRDFYSDIFGNDLNKFNNINNNNTNNNMTSNNSNTSSGLDSDPSKNSSLSIATDTFSDIQFSSSSPILSSTTNCDASITQAFQIPLMTSADLGLQPPTSTNTNRNGNDNNNKDSDDAQTCIGRLLIYRQGRMLVVLLLEDWKTNCGPKFYSSADVRPVAPTAATGGGLSGDETEDSQIYGSVSYCSNMKNLDEQLNSASGSSVTTNINYGDYRLLKLCSIIQKGVKSELQKLQAHIEDGAANDNSNPVQTGSSGSSSSNSSSSNGGISGYSGNNSGAQATGESDQNKGAGGGNNRAKIVDPLVRLLYLNRTNRAIVVKNVYRFKTDPLIFWPYNILNRRLSNSVQNFFRSVALDVRPRFPHSGSLIACCLDPKILSAIGDIADLLSRKDPASKVSEVCLRVTTAPRGGIWVIGRVLDDRLIFMVVEKCSTLNDVFELYTQTLDGFLGQVML